VTGDANADENFRKFVKGANRFLTFVQNTRNAIEHPTAVNAAHIRDSRLTAEGKVVAPSFALAHIATPQDEVPLLVLMKSAEETVLAIFELLMAHLCDTDCQGFAGMALWVVPIEEGNRKSRHVGYGYVTKMGDQVVPLTSGSCCIGAVGAPERRLGSCVHIECSRLVLRSLRAFPTVGQSVLGASSRKIDGCCM
jgi:hypothetical protein